MNGWPQAAIRESIGLLAKGGRNDLASDLDRILSTIDFEALEIMRNPDSDALADDIVAAETISHLVDALNRFSCLMGVDHCTVHVVSEASSSSFTTKVLTTYPQEWISRYVDRRYYYIDPVITASRAREQGFYWDALDASGPILRTFWTDAAAFGLDPSGYTLPITTEKGDRLALSVSASAGEAEFRDAFTQNLSDAFNLGILLADAFCRLASEDRPDSFSPTDDQLTVLRLIATGASESDLKRQPYLYGSYSTLARSICSLFRTTTVAQAAVLAGRIGLLDDAPLTKADILSASDKSLAAATASTAQSMRRLVRLRSTLLTQDPAEADASVPTAD